jgi:hypothetical protein
MSRSKQVDKQRWKVPFPIKVAMGIIGTFFILVAIAGTLVHGQGNITAGFNSTAPESGPAPSGGSECVKNDPNNGLTYVALKCIIEHDTRAQMCSDLRTGATPINASKDAFDVLCNGIS